LSPAAEFAIRGVSVLVEEYGNGPVPLGQICDRRNLARQYLVKIFASLAKAGLVVAVRGKHGGYVLGRKPKDISLLEIIETVEGPIALNYCQHDPPRCDEDGCPMRPMWAEIQRIVRRKLGAFTLADCPATRSRKRPAAS
jgi:Rrf2 family protein